jgi:hypothetical protein
MQESSRNVRCGVFGKSRTGRSSRVPERFFVKILENFPVKLFWEKFDEVDHG